MFRNDHRLAVAAVAVFVAVALLGGAAGIAAGQDDARLPAAYYGDVTVNGEDAEPGTEITAMVNGVESGSITVEEAGEYGGPDAGDDKLAVQGDHIDSDDEVSFEVGIDGTEAEETVDWQSGDIQEVDLTFEDVDTDPEEDENGDDDTGTGTGGQPPADTDDDDVVDDVEDDVADDVEDDVVDDVEDDIVDDVIGDDEIVPDEEDVPEGTPTIEDVRQDLEAVEPNTRSTTPIVDSDPDRPGVNVVPEETESVSEITFNEGAEGNVDISEWQDPPQSVSESVSGSVTAAVEAEAEENIEAAASVPVVSDIDPDTDEVRGDSATVQKTVDADRLDDPSDAVIAHERGDSWALLETDVVETDDDEVTVEAETESFSLFAVAEVDTEEAPEEPDDGIGTTGLIGLLVVIALLIAAAVAYRQMNDGGDNNSL